MDLKREVANFEKLSNRTIISADSERPNPPEHPLALPEHRRATTIEASPLRRRRGFSTATKREGGRKERERADLDRRTREMSGGDIRGFRQVELR
ncbi:hypothetical protein Hanom_Chr12g01166551 [Helianthus anomalus]